jgi:hypothetical protein
LYPVRQLADEIENPKSEIITLVARPGFEPRQTVPKTVVLPLYYQAISFGWLSIPKRNANIGGFFCSQKLFVKRVKTVGINHLSADSLRIKYNLFVRVKYHSLLPLIADLLIS